MKEVEKEKLFAEKLNGRLAMLGIIAGLGDLPNNRYKLYPVS